MGNLDDVLRKHAKRLGIERQVEAVGVVEAATEEIAKYIDRNDFEVISFNQGTLKISAQSSVAANEINLHLKELTKEIKKKVSGDLKIFVKPRS